MDLATFFSELLDLSAPYYIERVDKTLRADGLIDSVHLLVGVDAAYRPAGYERIHSYTERTWQHLHLFQYPCYLTCRIPTYQNRATGDTYSLPPSWARPYSGFSLLMEKQILALIRLTGCVSMVARQLGITTARVQKVYDDYTLPAFEQRVVTSGQTIGIDETSTRKGHDYITVFVDLATRQVVDIEDGKGADAVTRFAQKLPDPAVVKAVSIDMSPAFIAGVKEAFPAAPITFDKFHVVRLVNRYLDEIKTEDAPKIHYFRELFQHVWTQPTRQKAAALLQAWCDQIAEAFDPKSLINSIQKHFNGIVQYAESKINNAALEGINSVIQCLKRAARGYHYKNHFKRMILFFTGALNPVTYSPRTI
jgi:transposase